jgi:[acyl-carrier-protein] S-malonyltransferase
MKQKGAKLTIVLPVSVPSHCALMQPAADKLAILLDTIEIKTPKIPILHNRDVQIYTEAHEIRRILCEQLVQPVRWVETIQALARYGVSHIIECGPAKVLSGLIKRIDSDIYLNNMDTPESLSEIACLQPI